MPVGYAYTKYCLRNLTFEKNEKLFKQIMATLPYSCRYLCSLKGKITSKFFVMILPFYQMYSHVFPRGIALSFDSSLQAFEIFTLV